MKRENGRVVIEIEEGQFALLLLALGIATGNAGQSDFAAAFLRLANTINEGNPDWTPYKLPAETAT
jgi:hypothetical protein